MKLSFFSVVAALLVAKAQADGHSNLSAPLFYTGYLADMLCTRLEIAPDGANMLLDPESHTVRCELLPACVRSGYGLVTDIGSDGEPLFRVAAVFDESANDYIVDMLNSMDSTINDLRIRVRSTFLETTDGAVTPSITSSDGERFWPAMNDVPLVTIDQLEFCNYQGPDAKTAPQGPCASTDSILELLSSDAGRETLAGINLCMNQDIAVSSDDSDYMIQHSGCADHATFQDVKRADAETCNPMPAGDCSVEGTCESECTDPCGNPVVLPSGRTAKSCCLDQCGVAILDPCVSWANRSYRICCCLAYLDISHDDFLYYRAFLFTIFAVSQLWPMAPFVRLRVLAQIKSTNVWMRVGQLLSHPMVPKPRTVVCRHARRQSWMPVYESSDHPGLLALFSCSSPHIVLFDQTTGICDQGRVRQSYPG